MIDLLTDERLVASMNNDRVLLTNQRLQLIYNLNYRIIQLSQISFIEVEVKYQYYKLVIAVALFFGGFAAGDESLRTIGVVAFIILFAMYILISSKHILVRSSSGAIGHRINGIKNSDVQRFVFLVQENMSRQKKV